MSGGDGYRVPVGTTSLIPRAAKAGGDDISLFESREFGYRHQMVSFLPVNGAGYDPVYFVRLKAKHIFRSKVHLALTLKQTLKGKWGIIVTRRVG